VDFDDPISLLGNDAHLTLRHLPFGQHYPYGIPPIDVGDPPPPQPPPPPPPQPPTTHHHDDRSLTALILCPLIRRIGPTPLHFQSVFSLRIPARLSIPLGPPSCGSLMFVHGDGFLCFTNSPCFLLLHALVSPFLFYKVTPFFSSEHTRRERFASRPGS